MPVTVVGSIAFDAVKTPFGARERMLGGAAVHFALAASFFDDVRIVGPVGDDFGEAEFDVLAPPRHRRRRHRARARGGHSSGSGVYGWDLNARETLDTQLGVFEHFAPEALGERRARATSSSSRTSSPIYSVQVRAQCADARFAALDSMNLWIDVARDALVAAIAEVDCLILNDAELRQLTGKPNLLRGRAGGAVVGSRAGRRRQAGRVRRRADHRGGLLLDPRVCRWRRSSIRPAPETPSPAASSATWPHTAAAAASAQALLRRAMAYGTALASFNVEEFGTERVARLTFPEVAARVADLRRMTTFSVEPGPRPRH